MAKGKSGSSETRKITFGKRKKGKARKSFTKLNRTSKPHVGQER